MKNRPYRIKRLGLGLELGSFTLSFLPIQIFKKRAYVGSFRQC